MKVTGIHFTRKRKRNRITDRNCGLRPFSFQPQIYEIWVIYTNRIQTNILF